MNWKDKFIINIQKQSNLVCNSQTIYDDETIDKEISFEELVNNQKLIGQYAKNATEQEIAELIEKHGLELTERSLMTLLRTVVPLSLAYLRNKELVVNLFIKNPALKKTFNVFWEAIEPKPVEETETTPTPTPTLNSGEAYFYYQELREGKISLLDVPRNLLTEDMCYWAVTYQNFSDLSYIPEHLRSFWSCVETARKDPNALQYVPEELLTNHFYLCLVNGKQNYLQYVPKEMLTEYFYLEWLEKDRFIYKNFFKIVPDHLVTIEFGLKAIDININVIEFIPEKLMTNEFYLAVVNKDTYYIRYIPEEFRSREVCLKSISEYGDYIKHFPVHLLTRDFYLDAIKINPDVFKFVPESLLTDDFYLEALEMNGNIFFSLPKHLQTEENSIKAIEKGGADIFLKLPKHLQAEYGALKAMEKLDISDGYIFKVKLILRKIQTPKIILRALEITPKYWIDDIAEEIPKHFMTEDFLLEAIKKCPNFFNFIPDDAKTEKLCLFAIKYPYIYLDKIPERFKTKELCSRFILDNPSQIYSVPKRHRTKGMWLFVLNKDPEQIRNIPEYFLTHNICLEALKKEPKIFINIPTKFLTQKMISIAVEYYPRNIEDAPEHLMTPKFCSKLIRQNPDVLRFMSEKFKIKAPKACLEAVEKNLDLFFYLPDSLKTQELCLKTLYKDGTRNANLFPRELLTKDFCLKCLEINEHFFEYIPSFSLTQEMCIKKVKEIVPNTCSAFYKYFTIQLMNGLSRFHNFEYTFFANKELLSMENVKKYHLDNFFSKFSSNNAVELYKLLNKKKELVDYKVDKIENIDALNSEGINKLYSTYIFPIKQAEFLQKAPEEMKDYLKTIEYLVGEGNARTDELIYDFEKIPAKSEIEEKHPVLKHKIMEINGFKFEILDRADETGLILGNLTGCCQVFGGANSDAVYDGFLNPKSNFLAVYYKDRLIAQSWLRLGKSNVLYLDNIESNAPFSVEYKENFNKEKYELLRYSFMEFAETMKREYNLLNVIVGEYYSDVTFEELLLDTPTVKEDFVEEDDLTSDLRVDKNYVLAKKLNNITTFKTNITKIVKGKRKL